MKKYGKLSKALAICLTLMLAIGLFSTTAFASASTFAITPGQTGTITVTGIDEADTENVTVNAYRLMDVKVNANGQPQDPVYTWVEAVSDWARTNYSTYIGTGDDDSVQPAFSAADTSTIAEFYDALAAAIKSGDITLTSTTATSVTEGTATFNEMTMGNYLVLIEGGMKIYSPVAVNLVPTWNETEWLLNDATATAKAEDITIDKTVNDVEADNVSIGDTVTFDIIADIPTFPANALAKNYSISDTLPTGLTLTEGSIRVYGVPAEGNEVLLTEGEGNDYTLTTGGDTTFTLTFDYDEISTYADIHVTYTAMLNGNAVPGTANTNNAEVTYTNNPYVENSSTTKEDEATVYTYGLDISKVDADDKEQTLTGAEIELYASSENATSGTTPIAFVDEGNGTYRKATANDETTTTTLAVDENGQLILKGLDAGTWYLKETKAPDSYNLLESPIEVQIVANTDGSTGLLDGTVQNASTDNNALRFLEVANDDGFQLPVTGGMGTVIFTAVGVALMGAAIVLVIIAVKKRKA